MTRFSQPHSKTSIAQEAHDIVDRLLELEESTHPAGDPVANSTASRVSIKLANTLFELLAGWAIRHQAGLVIRGLDELAKLPSNEDRSRKIDDPTLESELNEIGQIDSATKRKIIVAVLSQLNCVPMAEELCWAIRGLDFGRQVPLLERKKHKRKRGYDTWLLRFWAVKHVAYLEGLTGDKDEAVTKVSECYGVAFETVIKWESNTVVKEFGKDFVGAEKSRNKYFGNLAAKHLAEESLFNSEADYIHCQQELLGHNLLEQHGREYSKLSASKKNNTGAI